MSSGCCRYRRTARPTPIPTGKRLVNASDLTAPVSVPHCQSAASNHGCQSPRRLSGSDPLPLRKIVVNDGVYVQSPAQPCDVADPARILSSRSHSLAKVTHILAKRPNANPGTFSFNNTSVAMTAPNGVGRTWGSPTADVTLCQRRPLHRSNARLARLPGQVS